MEHEAAFSDPTRERNIFVGRIIIASFFVAVMALVILARYADLQVTQHQDFVTNSDNNRVHIRPVPPARGVIYDRNGEILADNRPTSNLTIIRERTKDLNNLITKIGSLIRLSDADIKRFYKRLERRRPFEQTPLKFNLSAEEQAILAVNEYLLEGIKVSARLTRSYPKGELFAHVVGYVGRINDRELRTIDSIKYSGTDSIGKIGLEKFYEKYLLGEVGSEQVETNAKGRVMRVLDQTDPIAGDDLVLHLDSRLQQISYDAFDGERGALIAMDIRNGGILAMVSAPSYDPNLFVSGISQKSYDLLVNSTEKPLFNRAIRGQYPPGSTVKPLFGLIGLSNQNITTDTKIDDPGFFIMEGIERPWRDHNSKRGGHGSGVDLAKAIIESCDVFFYEMGIKTGIDALSSQSAIFGLGAKTGIDLPGEASGIMPTRKWKKESRNATWYNGDTINMSIGQGFMLTTPLQLAVMTSRIASKGNIIQPQIVKSINNNAQPAILLPNDSKIDEKHWTYIHRAMKDVVHSTKGTAKSISSGLLYQIAGKTGTAQVISINADEVYDKSKLNKRQWDHALFVAFAPAENPEIAIGLIVENGEHGSSVAAPIARKVLDAYLSNRADKGKQLVSKSRILETEQGYLAYAE
jgi:penicillin-binding protein 2